MEKRTYKIPAMDVVLFETKDVITTSTKPLPRVSKGPGEGWFDNGQID